MDPALCCRVLVIDDEPNIVNAVRRELCSPPQGQYRYEVEGFSDPAQALAVARSREFDAVICDYRMPGMDGLEFLKVLSIVQPDCARLVLSGRTDMAALAKMVNQTHIFRFIPKPWHDYFLKSAVAQAVSFSGALRENRRLAALVRERRIPMTQLEPGGADEILIIDDDAAVISSLTRLLAAHGELDDLFVAIRFELDREPTMLPDESRNRITGARTGHEALKLADTKQFSCVVSDFRMPEMDGIEVLRQFALKQPECTRILISGQIGQDELVRALETAHIFGFVAKPWQPYEFKACVGQGLAHRHMRIENRRLAEAVRASGIAA